MTSQPKPSRVDPFDLSDFKPAPVRPEKPKPAAAAIRSVSEAQGFPSRDPAPKEAPPAPQRVAQRRHRTGRNKQLSIKVTEETAARFTRIAEAQGLVLGECLAQALDALEARLAK